MKKTLILIFIAFLSISAIAQQYIVSFNVTNIDEAYKLPNYVGVEDYNNGNVTAYIYGNNFDKFKQLGYDYELKDHPSKGKSLTMATTVAQMANWDRYPTHDVYLQMVDQLATDYPDICRVETIGVSEEGRPVKVIKISDNPDDNENEPEFYYTGQMHGDEIVAYILFLRLAYELLENYGTDDQITNLINNTEIWINPLSNPDGTYSGGDNTVSGATRSNSNGVDLNRNFPTPNTPHPSGENAAEIQMQIAFAQAHNFVMSANSHSGIELVNYPWDTWTSNVKTHPDNNWWDHVSYNFANTIHDNAPGSYFQGQGDGVTHGGDWYVVDGSRQDHMGYYQYCREVTLEFSNDKMLDCEDLPAHWGYTRDAMLNYIEECFYGFNGTVTNNLGEPVNAKIEIVSHDMDNSEVYTDPVNGDYYRPIEPGTYDVTFSADCHTSQTVTVTVTDWETTTNLDIVLQKNETTELSGTVIDAQTGEALESVTIEFLNSDFTNLLTNSEGFYSIELCGGTYQVKASLDGYSTSIQEITISDDNNEVNFQLLPSTSLSFEDGIPTGFTFSGDVNWVLVTDEAYDGDNSMYSGNVVDNQNSIMEYSTTTEAGEFSFYHLVSSEVGYDFLTFYIDGNEQDTWSGTGNTWTEASYNISAGSHTFKWEYSKDGSVGEGDDCAWVDYISLPSQAPATYNLTFEVTDGTTPIEDATVILTGYGSQNTNVSGNAIFSSVYSTTAPGLSYSVSATDYQTITGNVEVTGTMTIPVNLQPADSQNIYAESIHIFPNPTSGVINIKLPEEQGVITILSSDGKIIRSIIVNSLNQTIDLSNQPSGLYMFKYTTDNKSYTEKIIIQ